MQSVAGDAACYLVEWYPSDLTGQRMDDVTARLCAAAEGMREGGTPVWLLLTLAVPTDEVFYAAFAAESSEIVVQVCKQAGVPLERLSADVAARISGYREAPSFNVRPIP